VKAMTVTVQVLSVKVTSVLSDSLFEDPSRKELHYLGEDILALVHILGLLKASKITKRSLQIVKCQRAI
jgi:hypothetical protein